MRPDEALDRIDAYQRARPWLAVPYAVGKRFGELGVGRLAAALSYYGFFSLFPLLLVLSSVAGYLLHNNPDLRERLLGAIDAGLPPAEAARFLGVGASSIQRWRRRQQETGSLAASITENALRWIVSPASPPLASDEQAVKASTPADRTAATLIAVFMSSLSVAPSAKGLYQ